MLLSICIPTYNRAKQLPNCLNSILLAKRKSNIDFEVCISDNGSRYNIDKVIKPFKKKLKIKINKNKKNQGYMTNLLKVISIASGEYVWAIGDDDLLVPKSLYKIDKILKKNKDVDFFYINSFYLNYSYLDKFKKPFNTKYLPKKMEKISKKKDSQRMDFWDLIDRNVSFDFLLGNFLNIFKRKMWLKHASCLDKKLLKDKRPWSNFDNTCGHTKIYANAFTKSKAFFCAEGLTVNSYGVREWSRLYPLIEIVRLPEILDYYRSKGMNFSKYLINKNYALRNFSNYFLKIFLGGEKSGLNYINYYRHFFCNLFYPNVYLSIFYFLYRKAKNLLFKNDF